MSKKRRVLTYTKLLATITVASGAFSCSDDQGESTVGSSGSGGKSGSGGSAIITGGTSSGGSATGGSSTGGSGTSGGSSGTGGAGGTSTGGSSGTGGGGTSGTGGSNLDGGQPIGAICVSNTNCDQSQGTTVCCTVTGCSAPCECQLQANCPAGVPYLPCNTGSDCAQFGGGKVCCEETNGSTTQRFCTKQSGCSGNIIP